MAMNHDLPSDCHQLYQISILSTYGLERAWNQLESSGIEVLYSTEEENRHFIYAYLNSQTELHCYPWIVDCSLHLLTSIDWNDQWANHGQNFHDGFVHIDLSPYKQPAGVLKLQPGPGFGDLSHPTTRLILYFLGRYLHNHTVVDIGCGSGILTIAAALMGAEKSFGIDIDEKALEHSQLNASLNEASKKCIFCQPEEFVWKPSPHDFLLVLMNMIATEQHNAWNSLTSLHHLRGEALISGILEEERDDYHDLAKKRGWSLLDEKEESGWFVFYFKI